MPNWDRFTFTEKTRRQTLGKMIQHFCWAQNSAWKSYFQQHFGVWLFLPFFNQQTKVKEFNSIAIDKYAHIKHTAAIANMNLINIWTICGCWTAIIHHTASSLNSISRSHSVLDATLFNFIVWLSGWTQPNSLKRWFSTELEVHCLIFNN